MEYWSIGMLERWKHTITPTRQHSWAVSSYLVIFLLT